MFNAPNFLRRFARRTVSAWVFSFALSAGAFAQQITCPVAHPATNTSATATNSLNPCTIEPLGIFTNAKTGTLENKSGAALINDMQLTNDGTVLNDAGAVLTNNASLSNAAGATLNNSGILNGTGTIQNGGTLNNLGNGSIFAVIDNLGGTINNKSGIPMGLASGSVIQGGTLNAATTPTVWENNVTFDGSTGYGALTIQGTVENDGSVSTTLHVLGTINNEGTIQLNNAGFPTTATLSVDGNTRLQGGGKLNLLGQVITEGGSGTATLTNVNNTIQGSGIVNLGSSGNFVNQGTVNTNISGQQLVIIAGSVTNSGVMETTGGATLTFGAPLTFVIPPNVNNKSGGSIVAGAGSTINNEAGVTLFNNAGAKISNAGTFNNSGTIINDGGATITNSGVFQSTPLGTGTLVNYGTVTNLGSISSVVNNFGGTIATGNGSTGGIILGTGSNIQGGTLNAGIGNDLILLGNNVTLSGSSAFGALTLQGQIAVLPIMATTEYMNGTINNEGTIQFDGATSPITLILNGNTTLQGGGTVRLLGGGGNPLGGMTIESLGGATLTNVNNTIQGSGLFLGGTLVNKGTVDASVPGLTFFNSRVTNTGVMEATVGGTLTFESGSTVSNNSGGSIISDASSTIINEANATLNNNSGAKIVNAGTFTNDGMLTNYGSIINDKGATLINGGSFIDEAGSSFVNEGTFTLEKGSSFTDGGTFTNNGTLNVEPGAVLSKPGGYVQHGGQTVVDGTLNSASVKILGGTFSGSGTVTGSVLNSGGIVLPGANGTPGTLVVQSYEQQSGATFDELIGASGNGTLAAVSGGIELDAGALLDIDLLNGFKPTDGETFDIMGALQISGVFANAPTAGFQMDGFDWTITYDPGEIILDAVSPASSGTNAPEPSSFLLLMPALAALAFLRRRTKELDA